MGAAERGQAPAETQLRQPCPRCKDDMMRMYRRRRGVDTWDYVWFCLTCRHEVVIPDEG